MTSLSNHANGFCQTYTQEQVIELIETGTIEEATEEEVTEMKQDLKNLISALYEEHQ